MSARALTVSVRGIAGILTRTISILLGVCILHRSTLPFPGHVHYCFVLPALVAF